MESNIREPRQKRAIEKKEKIITSGFELICKYGYYNITTADIAKAAGVSTGIVYQYFNDKHDILMDGLEKYGDDIFYPMIKIPKEKINADNYEKLIMNTITKYVKNHKVSKAAHEEIMAMVHSDKDVAKYFYECELKVTRTIKKYLMSSNFNDNNLTEKAHVVIGIIDNLCHEIIYHNHKNMNYTIMTKIVINSIKDIFKNDLDN